jgi:hypothetical protein
VGLFNDVGIIVEDGKKLTWYLRCMQKIIKHLNIKLDYGTHKKLSSQLVLLILSKTIQISEL